MGITDYMRSNAKYDEKYYSLPELKTSFYSAQRAKRGAFFFLEHYWDADMRGIALPELLEIPALRGNAKDEQVDYIVDRIPDYILPEQVNELDERIGMDPISLEYDSKLVVSTIKLSLLARFCIVKRDHFCRKNGRCNELFGSFSQYSRKEKEFSVEPESCLELEALKKVIEGLNAKFGDAVKKLAQDVQLVKEERAHKWDVAFKELENTKGISLEEKWARMAVIDERYGRL